MMRIADILWAVPSLLMVILLMVVLPKGLFTIIIAMTITGWINMARIVRGQVLQLKNQEYVLASQTLGAKTSRLLFKHIVPNAMGSILVTMTLTVPTAIFTEAFLSYLGLGVPAPLASWGTMASDGLPALTYYPWRLFFPAGFICITMFGFNVVGDGLRDALILSYVNKGVIRVTRLLEVKDLAISFKTYGGEVQAIRGVNFHLIKGRRWPLLENQVPEKV